jgi:hypothetical protein
MQKRIHDMEGKSYRPELLLSQPEDVASMILNALNLPQTAKVMDVHIRPAIKTRSSGFRLLSAGRASIDMATW